MERKRKNKEIFNARTLSNARVSIQTADQEVALPVREALIEAYTIGKVLVEWEIIKIYLLENARKKTRGLLDEQCQNPFSQR